MERKVDFHGSGRIPDLRLANGISCSGIRTTPDMYAGRRFKAGLVELEVAVVCCRTPRCRAPPRKVPLTAKIPFWDPVPGCTILDQLLRVELPIMTFSILPPASANQGYLSDSSDDGSLDSEDDVDMLDTTRPSKRAKHSHSSIITPGETITDDPQWMR